MSMSCSLFGIGTARTYTSEDCEDPRWIASEGDTYTFWNRSSGIAGSMSQSIHFNGFSGRQTLWTLTNTNGQPIDLDVSIISNATTAQVFAVWLVSNQGSDPVKLVDKTDSLDTVITLNEGTHAFKIVGFDAHGSVSIDLADPLPPGLVATTTN
jgi:hypothetical protein